MFTPLLSETGQFYLDRPNSDYVVFAYKGDESFCNRTENLLINYGAILNGSVKEITKGFYYCLVPMKRLVSCLKDYFRGEIIREKTKEIDYVVSEIKDEFGDTTDFEIFWDEGKVAKMAEDRTELFLQGVNYQPVDIYFENAPHVFEYPIGNHRGAE